MSCSSCGSDPQRSISAAGIAAKALGKALQAYARGDMREYLRLIERTAEAIELASVLYFQDFGQAHAELKLKKFDSVSEKYLSENDDGQSHWFGDDDDKDGASA